MIRVFDLRPWKRHERWRRDVSAAIDGELDAAANGQLRAHLGACEACRVYDRDLRSTRASLVALREAETPRSFRLTPSMIAAPARPPVRDQRGSTVMRGAQLATALAVVALAVVSVVDFSDTGTKRSANSTSSLADAAPQSAKSGPNAGASTAGGAFGTAPEDTHAPQPDGPPGGPATAASGSVAIPTPRGPNSASTGCDGAQPLNPNAPASATSQPTPCESVTSGSADSVTSVAGTPAPARTPASNEATPTAAQREQSATGEPAIAPATVTISTKAGWYRPAEVALGILAAMAAVTVIILSLRTRGP